MSVSRSTLYTIMISIAHFAKLAFSVQCLRPAPDMRYFASTERTIAEYVLMGYLRIGEQKYSVFAICYLPVFDLRTNIYRRATRQNHRYVARFLFGVSRIPQISRRPPARVGLLCITSRVIRNLVVIVCVDRYLLPIHTIEDLFLNILLLRI